MVEPVCLSLTTLVVFHIIWCFPKCFDSFPSTLVLFQRVSVIFHSIMVFSQSVFVIFQSMLVLSQDCSKISNNFFLL